MISLRKCQLLSALILVFICVPTLGNEPNETKTELKFEISKKERQLRFEEDSKFGNSVKPKYVAIFSMSDLSQVYGEPDIGNRDPETAKMILATSAGQSMSQIQKELLKTAKVICTIGITKNPLSKPLGRPPPKATVAPCSFALSMIAS